MLISEKYNFIFVHIYKNAGTSIKSALKPFALGEWEWIVYKVLKKIHIPPRFDPKPFRSHVTASDAIDVMGREKFDSFFSFAIVRNPWDWQVSLYKYISNHTTHHQHEIIKNLGSFDEYIRWRHESEIVLQKDFIYSGDGDLLVDFVGRFEQLDTDFATICSRTGIPTTVSLPRLNVSNTRPYQEYYSEESKELVRQAFQPDIALFGYEF